MTNVEINTVTALIMAMRRLHHKEVEVEVWKAQGTPGSIDKAKMSFEDMQRDRQTIGTCLQILELNF